MVLSERRWSAAILTLLNPEKYNALGGSLLGDLNVALDVTRRLGHLADGRGKWFLLPERNLEETHSTQETASLRAMRGTINPHPQN
jgi:hypothetical protein